MKTVASQLRGWGISSRYLRAAGLVLVVALVSLACASTPKTRYYTMRIFTPPHAQSPKTNFILQVEHFDAPNLLQDNRIIYYTSPTELNFHEYHRWSSQPGELLSDLAMKYFAETGLFRQVYAYPAPVDADFTLRGRLLGLGQMKYEKGGRGKAGEARIGLELDLLQTRQNKIIWSARLRQTEPVEKKKVQAFVQAMNIAVQHLLQQAYGGISQVVEHQVAQRQQVEQAH